jgi:ABC-type dipeptide/oligopeptide/nickel transport system ATPase component
VLFGESGAGKSLFMIKLIQEILKDREFSKHLIVFFKLRDLSGESSTEEQLSKL